MEAEKDFQVGELSLNAGQKMMTVKEAGQRGGLSTLAKYGANHFQRAGAIGGRVAAIRYRSRSRKWGSRGRSKMFTDHTVTTDVRRMGADEQFGGKQPDAISESKLASSSKRATAQQKSGRKGGLSTVNRHGRAHMSFIGSLGGRPTFEEALERIRYACVESSGRASKKGGIGAPP